MRKKPSAEGRLACSWKSSVVREASVRDTAEHIDKKIRFRETEPCRQRKEKKPPLLSGAAPGWHVVGTQGRVTDDKLMAWRRCWCVSLRREALGGDWLRLLISGS